MTNLKKIVRGTCNRPVASKNQLLLVIVLNLVFFKTPVWSGEYSDIMHALVPHIVRYEQLQGGMSNNITLCHTLDESFIFRSPKIKSSAARFKKILDISKKAAGLQLAPQIYAIDNVNQCTVLEYIDSVQWPQYEHNRQPYHSTMHLLRTYHDAMRSEVLQNLPESYAPLSGALKSIEELAQHDKMPEQLGTAALIMKGYQHRTSASE